MKINPSPRAALVGLLGAGLLVAGAVPALAKPATDIRVDWQCTSITVSADKDLSNVVLRFADGDEHKFDDLNQGRTGSFSGTGANAGETIATAWVKAGNNHSGDGSGFGQRFDTPLDCASGDDDTPPPPPPGETCAEDGMTVAQIARALRNAGSDVHGANDAQGTTATVVLPDGFCDATVNFSSYQVPFESTLQPYDQQRLFDNKTVTVTREDSPLTISIAVPSCNWQTDLYTGPVITVPPHHGTANGNVLIDWGKRLDLGACGTGTDGSTGGDGGTSTGGDGGSTGGDGGTSTGGDGGSTTGGSGSTTGDADPTRPIAQVDTDADDRGSAADGIDPGTETEVLGIAFDNDGSASAAAAEDAAGDALPRTGLSTILLALAAMSSLLLGSGVVRVTRRRDEEPTPGVQQEPSLTTANQTLSTPARTPAVGPAADDAPQTGVPTVVVVAAAAALLAAGGYAARNRRR